MSVQAAEPVQETSAVAVRAVKLFTLALFALLAVTAAGVWLLVPSVRQYTIARPPDFGGPSLEGGSAGSYRQWRAAQADLLAGRAPAGATASRMPIDEAMRRVQARGRAAYQPLEPVGQEQRP